MGDFYKVMIEASAYPSIPPRCIKVEKGDALLVSYIDGENILDIGDRYKNYDAVVIEVIKEPYKCCKFWQKPMVLGYKIMFT